MDIFRFIRRKSGDSMTLPAAIDVVRQSLDALQCEYTSKTAENGNTHIEFSFQGGNFFIDLLGDTRFGSMTYPTICELDDEYIDPVRFLCNRMTQTSFVNAFSYHPDPDDGKVRVSITVALMIGRTDDFTDNLRHAMTSCFMAQRQFNSDIGSMVKSISSRDTGTDIELDTYHLEKIRLDILSHEKRHGNTATEPQTTATEIADKDITLDGLVRSLFPSVRSISNAKTLTRHDKTTWIDSAQYHPAKEFDTDPALETDVITADVIDNDNRSRHVTIAINRDVDSNNKGLLRVTAMLSAVSPTRENPLGHNGQGAMTACTVMSIDIDGERMQQEFDFMLADAHDKAAAGELEKLTDEQRMILHCESPDLGYCLYHGCKYFHTGRHRDALPLLLNAYQLMQDSFFTLTDDDRQQFLEVCFMIGVIMNRTGRYRDAFFYLDAVLQSNNMLWTMECINNLIDMNHFSARIVIENILDNIQSQRDKASSWLDTFIDYLHRRQAYVYIDLGLLDEAETILRPMLDDGRNKDFAIGEMAFIATLREQATRPSPTSRK